LFIGRAGRKAALGPACALGEGLKATGPEATNQSKDKAAGKKSTDADF